MRKDNIYLIEVEKITSDVDTWEEMSGNSGEIIRKGQRLYKSKMINSIRIVRLKDMKTVFNKDKHSLLSMDRDEQKVLRSIKDEGSFKAEIRVKSGLSNAKLTKVLNKLKRKKIIRFLEAYGWVIRK